MKPKKFTYPFVPKSANWLIPGHFWALPLSDGTFGCARVIDIPPKEIRYSSMEFLGGVLDWHSPHPPTPESIAGATCLTQGMAHIRSITQISEVILGHRDLALDGIEPWLFRGTHNSPNSSIYFGCIPIRPQFPEDTNLPVLPHWGYQVPLRVAEHHFVGKL